MLTYLDEENNLDGKLSVSVGMSHHFPGPGSRGTPLSSLIWNLLNGLSTFPAYSAEEMLPLCSLCSQPPAPSRLWQQLFSHGPGAQFATLVSLCGLLEILIYY